MDITCNLRATEVDVAEMGPQFQKAWVGLLVWQYMAVSDFSVYPYSRRHLHIKASNICDPVDFKTGFPSDYENVDIPKGVWGYKTRHKLVRPGPQAACIEIQEPLHGHIASNEYTLEDDVVLEQWLRENISTVWHLLGTRKMSPLDKMGAVDANFNVHGVKTLKVIDLSVAPSDVAANTSNTAMVSGEKGSDICIYELDLGKRQ
ncbi:GMC oxidoreductase-domain-containing protein [Xylariaceae sp. FL0255]|nr:GMC oxidoreductase-domain-containing protein [Xylariaceae sp. FL0255]